MKSATQSAEQTLSSSEDFDVSFPIGGIAKRSFDMTSAAHLQPDIPVDRRAGEIVRSRPDLLWPPACGT